MPMVFNLQKICKEFQNSGYFKNIENSIYRINSKYLNKKNEIKNDK